MLAHVQLSPLRTTYGTWEPEGRGTGGLKVLRDVLPGPGRVSGTVWGRPRTRHTAILLGKEVGGKGPENRTKPR